MKGYIICLRIFSNLHYCSTTIKNLFSPNKQTKTLKLYPRTLQATMEVDALMRGDKLVLKGLMFHGFHGVLPEERVLGQKFVVDVDAWMDLRAAGKSDSLSDTLSYTDIYSIVKEAVERPPHNLLESVAQQIATTTVTKHNHISAVRVKVKKPQVAVQGPVDYLGIEILRLRGDV